MSHHRSKPSWLLIAIPLLTTLPGVAVATEEFAQAESLDCSHCHVDSEPTRLTDPGRYYQFMETLDGYDKVLERFGRCTFCHVDEAGSLEMTNDGRRFRWMMADMKGLQAWLEAEHPGGEDLAAEETPGESEAASQDDGE